MRIFVFEFMTAACPEGPASLRVEGQAMLRALVDDFSLLPGIETWTLLHANHEGPLGHSCRRVVSQEEPQIFRELAARADFSLVIAPESAGRLATRSQWVLDAGGRLLGSSPQAIQLAADKWAMAQHLASLGVPTPPTALVPRAGNVCPAVFPAVCKPRHGAGSEATFLVRSSHELKRALEQAQAEVAGDDFILQPFCAGLPASVVFFVGPRTTLSMQPSRQRLSADGRFHYQGGEVPLPSELAHRAIALGQRVLPALSGLLGYVGIDMVLGDVPDGSGDHVIEINPRWTTSYIGLRRLARTNLAATLLALVTGQECAALAWNSGTVRFWPDGRVEYD
jgi:predicted ATP-grasp superfamily ATP-dependent carboligase